MGRDSMEPEAVLEGWSNRTGEHSPAYYAHHGPTETSELIREALDATVGSDASVLELGCSSGRHLAHLHEHGYEDLAGIDVNPDAFSVMQRSYPELAAGGTFYHGAIEDVLPGFEDGRFDAVYSQETLQHVHRDHAWVFGEVARVTGDVLVTVEVERPVDPEPSSDSTVAYIGDDLPLYYRNWADVFAAFDLREVDVTELDRDTLRVFRTG